MSGLITVRTIELLREERAKLLKLVAHIDAIIEANGQAPVPEPRQRHDQPTGRRPGRQARYDWAMGQRMWEKDGAEVKEIADFLQCTKSAVKGAKKRYGWGPKGSLAAKKAAKKDLEPELVARAKQRRLGPPAKPRSYQSSRESPPSVKCTSCERMTEMSPCSHCHTVLPKALCNELAVKHNELGARP